MDSQQASIIHLKRALKYVIDDLQETSDLDILIEEIKKTFAEHDIYLNINIDLDEHLYIVESKKFEGIDDFTDFGPSNWEAEDEHKDKIDVSINELLKMPHFEDVNNCQKALDSLKTKTECTIETEDDENQIHIDNITQEDCVIRYNGSELKYSVNELKLALERCITLTESEDGTWGVAGNEGTDTKKKPSEEEKAQFGSSIVSFQEFFTINRVTQKQNLKGDDDYSDEHYDGDITRTR
jgi:hypothetical protein